MLMCLISSSSALTRKRGKALKSLDIPKCFLVEPDQLDVKRYKHGILYILSIINHVLFTLLFVGSLNH